MAFEKLPGNSEKKIQLSEEEQKLEIARSIEFSVEKKKLLERIDKDKKLAYLKSLVERWLLRPSTIEHIISDTELDSDEIREIFEKIDEMELIPDIDDFLPKNLRITKEQYLSALENRETCWQVLSMLDEALDFLYHESHTHASGITGIFTDIFSLLTQKKKIIMKIQGNVIDVKRSLK